MSGLVKQWTWTFLYSKSPAARARRYFWIKVAISLFYYAMWAAILTKLEPWFERHAFVSAITAFVAVIAWFAFMLAWHFRVSCPRCGWNINLLKTEFGSPGQRVFRIPNRCPNCGTDLAVEDA
jgi:ribosomal protein S27AE